MRIKDRRQGKGLVNQAQHQAHVGVFVARTQANVSPGDGFAPHRRTSILLCSRFEGATHMHPERCYATFIPNLERVTNFLVKNLPAVIHASGTVKKLGTSEQSLKLNQREHGEE